MASIYFPFSSVDIDYSLKDGRVREFKLEGIILFSEYDNIAHPNWEEILIRWVKFSNLHVDEDGNGLYSFVIKLIEDGKITHKHN
ncbi:MAG: hypothetical protein RIE52_11975 [Balneola sp.]